MDNESVYSDSINNQHYLNNGIMQLRIDPEPVLAQFHLLLSGTKVVVVQDKEGNYSEQEIQISNPLVNRVGINQIMHFVRNCVNPQTVQGNFKEEQYFDYISEAHKDLAELLFASKEKFEMTTTAMNSICNAFTKMIMPYMSRTIANKERDSYSATNRTVETINASKDRWNLFGNRGQ